MKYITKRFVSIMCPNYKDFEILLKNQVPGKNQEKEFKKIIKDLKASGLVLISEPSIITKNFLVK